MQRWKLTIEYKGTDYAGWQRQKGVPSIQQAIEEALSGFCQQDIRIHVAGRTDAGVHARGQVAHFDLDYGQRELTGFDLAKAINAHLRPQPVSVVAAEKVHAEFHARFDAVNKLYLYRILCRPSLPALEPGLLWHVKRDLDVAAMREGARHLLGHHDFTSFRDSQCQAKSPLRTLDRLDIETLAYDEAGGRKSAFTPKGALSCTIRCAIWPARSPLSGKASGTLMMCVRRWMPATAPKPARLHRRTGYI